MRAGRAGWGFTLGFAVGSSIARMVDQVSCAEPQGCRYRTSSPDGGHKSLSLQTR